MIKDRKSSSATKRKSGKAEVQYVTLRDGRKLVKPRPGGELTKTQIRAAVRTVVSQRKDTA